MMIKILRWVIPTLREHPLEAKLLEMLKTEQFSFSQRRRKHSRKKNGHRQRHSKIQITKILSKDGKLIASAENTHC